VLGEKANSAEVRVLCALRESFELKSVDHLLTKFSHAIPPKVVCSCMRPREMENADEEVERT
jgi:hypothetical protein